MPKYDSLWILLLLVSGVNGNLWFLQPPSKNEVLNGTETRIHCQLNTKADQVQWWFRPANAGSHWTVVKLYPNPSYVTKYDRFDRYFITDRVNIIDNAAVYAYDLTIKPVKWEDRGEWKCGVENQNGVSQSSVGELTVNIPLQSVAISSGGRPNVSNGGHEDTIVVDEHDDLTIWCRTGFAYPAPDNLEIYIDNEKQSKVEIQTHTAQNGLSRMTGSMMIKSVNRAKVHGSQITCRGQWRDQVSESRSQISVFFPTTSVSVQVDEVAWNELLQAHCLLDTEANPTPQITWYLANQLLDQRGPVLEYRVDRTHDRKQLRCEATHTKFRSAEKVRISSKSRRIRVQYPPSGEPQLQQTLTSGNELVFECITTVAYPASEIAIDFNANDVIRDAPIIKPDVASGGYQVSQKLTIRAEATYFNRSVTCTESWPTTEQPVFKMMSRDWAMIPHAPEKVVLTVNGQQVESETVMLTKGQNEIGCTVFGGYPYPPRSDFLVTVDNEPINLKKTQTGYAGMYEVGKRHHQRELRCSLQTANDKLASATMMNVTFPAPTIDITFERNQYNVGDVVRVAIETGASYPSANISCQKRHYDESIDLAIGKQSLVAAYPYGTMSNASLQFTTTRFDHGATVQCTTDNGLTSTLELNVLTAPFFMPNTVFEVSIGDNLIIPIDRLIRANPPQANIEWRKITPKSKLLTIDQESRRLILSNVKQSDMGEYFVKGDDVQGNFNIIVLSPPTLYISGATQIVTGQELDLTCFAEGRPAPRVYWTRGYEKIFVGNGTKLIIPAMDTSAADTYNCHGVNSLKSVEKSVDIVVQHAPNVTATASRVIVYPDEPITLGCMISAIPRVNEVVFIPPQHQTQLQKSYSGRFVGNEWRIVFSKPTDSHFGEWTCMGKNRLAKDTATIMVQPAGAPESASNLVTEVLNGHSAKIIWKRGDENGYEQKFRISVVSTEVTSNGKPQHEKEYLTYNNNLVIRNLTENMSYTLRIVAENKSGRSLPFEYTYHFTSSNTKSAGMSYLLISLFGCSLIILLVLLVALFIHKKREMIYQTKKMGDDHDGRSLSESENLMKDDDVHTSRDDSLTKQRVLQDPLHYYTLQCTKTLPSPPPPMLTPDHLDYSPATEQPMLQASDQYGHTLCHRHRQYDTMPKLIDTTSGYCSSSNSSYSNSSGIPRSRSFQPSNRKSKRKSSEGVLV